MKIILLGLAAVALLACNNADQKQKSATENVPTNSINTQQQSDVKLLTNPAHGQPGHDCAKPVGAPLKQDVNVQPTNQQQINVQPTTQTAPVAQPSAAPTTAQKTNPAHGMPGHDCAKPVGAPLS